jgi:hypothetical protein
MIDKFRVHDLLAPVYGWSTEGSDTVDSRETKVVVEKLQS